MGDSEADHIKSKDIVFDCMAQSLTIKLSCLDAIVTKTWEFKRIRESVFEDLRKIHDMGPHLISKNVRDLFKREGIDTDPKWMQNESCNRKIFGEKLVLHLEHVFPVRQTVLMILDPNRKHSVTDILKNTSCTAWILKAEDNQIKEKSFRSSPKLSYQNAGIELLEKVDEKWIEFDWSQIEAWAARSVR